MKQDPSYHKEYIKEVIEKSTQGNLEGLLREIQYELRGIKEKQSFNDRGQSQNQFDNSHSRIEEGRMRDDYIEIKIMNE